MNEEAHTKRHYHVYKTEFFDYNNTNGKYVLKGVPLYIKAIDTDHLVKHLEEWLKVDKREVKKDNWTAEPFRVNGDTRKGRVYFYMTKKGKKRTRGYNFELVE